MHINLSPEIEQFLQAKVNTGFYSNASEVVRDAIRRMWEEDQKLEKLRAAVRIGEDQLERGEGIAYTRELLEEITTTAIDNTRQHRPVAPDSAG